MAWLRDQPLVVRAFRKGDRNAMGKIYRHYVDQVLRLFRLGFATGTSRVPGLFEAGAQMDCAQEVFVRAFSEPARTPYVGERPCGPYLLRIARNYRIDQLRRSGREVSDATSLETGEAPAQDPVEDRHWAVLNAAAKEYLATLDETSREFVRLRFDEEGSQIDVAKALGVTRRRIRTLEAQVAKGLKQHLNRVGLSPSSESPAQAGPSLVRT